MSIPFSEGPDDKPKCDFTKVHPGDGEQTDRSMADLKGAPPGSPHTVCTTAFHHCVGTALSPWSSTACILELFPKTSRPHASRAVSPASGHFPWVRIRLISTVVSHLLAPFISPGTGWPRVPQTSPWPPLSVWWIIQQPVPFKSTLA